MKQDGNTNEKIKDLSRLFALENFTELITKATELLKSDPGNSNIKRMIAVSFYRLKDVRSALPIFLDILESEPNDATACNFVALIYWQMNQPGPATEFIQRAIPLNPNHYESYNTLSNICILTEQWQQAEIAARQCLKFKPDYAPAMANLGESLLKQGKYDLALSSLEEAMKCPRIPLQTYVLLSVIYRIQGKADKADDLITKGKIEAEKSADDLFFFSGVMLKNRLIAQAEGCLELASKMKPNHPPILERLASVYRMSGKFEKCTSLTKEVIALDPNSASGYYNFVYSKKMREEDAWIISNLQRIAKSSKVESHKRALAHYALGKYHDDLHHFELAAKEFESAHVEILKTIAGQEIAQNSFGRNCEFSIKTFTKDFVRQHKKLASDGGRPIFILGMIRSGTTLAEQILSSHPDVTAGGELDFLLKNMNQCFDSVGHFVPSVARSIRDNYLRILENIDSKSIYVTDKMPSNCLILGLIYVLFPNAKVIHCQRNPGDNCVSVYTTPNGAIHYSHDRKEVTQVYRDYRQVMTHWESVVPKDWILHLQYEDLIADQENQTRRIIDFCGLNWDENCMDFSKNGRAILTPSTWQVRQPLYSNSLNRWQNYEAFFPEFADINKEFAS